MPAASFATKDVRAATPESVTLASGLPLSASMGSGLRVTAITSVAASAPEGAATGCTPSLTVAAEPGAMLNVQLVAPCHKGERAVLRHAGLSFTARVSVDGFLSLQVPALQTNALVTVLLRDSEMVLGSVSVPEATDFQRFALQWSAADVFDLRISEGDRIFVGDREARNRPGQQRIRSFGDRLVEQPMFAEIYTYPSDPTAMVDVAVEVTVSPQTCGQSVSAETILSASGKVQITEIPVDIPACDGTGDILVLKNLAPATKIVAAN